MPRLASGSEHLTIIEQFILEHASPPRTSQATKSRLRCLTLAQYFGEQRRRAHGVLGTLTTFRQQNPAAEICLVASKLGLAQYQRSSKFAKYLAILAEHQIEVDNFAGSAASTRQVMHGKAVVADDKMLFSTGAVMDTQPILKANFSIELPIQAASLFRRYVDEAMLGLSLFSAMLSWLPSLQVLGRDQRPYRWLDVYKPRSGVTDPWCSPLAGHQHV